MRRSDDRIEPVRKSRTVPLAQEQAFELFTERIDTWWPLETHSIALERVTAVRFEGWIGGRVVELTSDGEEHSWADVIAWDPPHRFVLAWHPSPTPDAASILEIRFAPSPSGGTDITLDHSGWEEFGRDVGTATRNGYESGWDVVLAPFEELGSGSWRNVRSEPDERSTTG